MAEVERSFKGRAIIPADLEGEARVIHVGFNAYASFYTSIHSKVETATCADSGNRERIDVEVDLEQIHRRFRERLRHE